MQLPDEAILYQYQNLLIPSTEEWTPAAELRSQHYLNPARLKALVPQLAQVRSQVATERDLPNVPQELQPLDAAFIDLPQKTLEQNRRQGETNPLGSILTLAARLREQVDRVIILGIGGSCLGARALFEALCHTYHNDLPPRSRPGVPRIYFEDSGLDNDSLNELLDLLQNTCVDPKLREERWGAVVVSKSGGTLETAVSLRILRREAAELYGNKSERLNQLIVPITGLTGRLRDLCKAEGYPDAEVLTIPANVSGRFSVLTPAGLLPAAVMGLDVRALLLGAAAMTQRFLDEPFERNPVLQFAAINFLMNEQGRKPIRVMSIWSRKLEGLGQWYAHLLAESLGKQGRGPTPVAIVAPRDLHARGQHHQEGARDKIFNNLVVKTPRTSPIPVGMADRNQDDLNALARKTLPDLLQASRERTQETYTQDARPAADLVLPSLSEHTLGQLMQMLMLATVVEGRLMGINPYGQPAAEKYKVTLRQKLIS